MCKLQWNSACFSGPTIAHLANVLSEVIRLRTYMLSPFLERLRNIWEHIWGRQKKPDPLDVLLSYRKRRVQIEKVVVLQIFVKGERRTH